MTRMYAHSKCCKSHWELVFDDGVPMLLCDRCEKPITDEGLISYFVDVSVRLTTGEVGCSKCEESDRKPKRPPLGPPTMPPSRGRRRR